MSVDAPDSSVTVSNLENGKGLPFLVWDSFYKGPKTVTSKHLETPKPLN